jgi:ABC-type transport system substrate-binding protein
MKTRRSVSKLFRPVGICAIAGCLVAASVWVIRAEESDSGAAKTTPAGETANAGPAARVIDHHLTRGGKAPAESDTLLLAYSDDPDTINPLTANDTVSEALQRLVYESLAERKFSDPDVWEPALAESWTFDKQNREYTIHMRKGVMWHPITLPNGEVLPPKEVTARDVKFTFDCILNKYIEAASLRSYYEDNDSTDSSNRYKIKVSLVRGDKYTVKVKWLKPYFQADEFTLGIAVIPQHVFSVNEKGQPISRDFSSKEFADGFNNHWANRQMCGTGPMVFKEWVKEQRVVLERNPNYWGEPFYFSRLVYRHISNQNTVLQQLLQNDIDRAAIAEKDHYVQSLDHPNVVSGKVVLEKYDYPAYRYLGYNLKREFFKDKRVRWAIGHAVPVDQIISTIFHGLATRITGPFLPKSSANDPDLKPVDFDLDKARALLDEAGWKMAEGESVRSKMVEGSKVKAEFDLMIFSDSPSFLSIAAIIKENCRKIGVDVTISPAKWALMLQKLRKKEFDATILGWAMGWKDDPYQIWDSSQADLPESSNHVGYANPEVDKLIAQLRVTMDPKEQVPLYRKIHRIIYDEQPYTFLFMEKATAGHDGRIQNVKHYPIRPCVDDREWYATTPRDSGK